MARTPALTTPTHWLCLLFGAALWLVAPKAGAWGDDGHRVVGELAWRYLSPTAQAAVAEALTEPGYETLAEAATWPDTYARRFPEYDPMKPFHYVDVDARAPSYQRERDCENGCVVTALAQFITLLESREPSLSLAERRRAIYWIAHFMGDIHQPLHIAHPDGKGGTKTLLGFFEAPDKRSAHWIWDFGLLERRPAPTGAPATSDQPAFRAIADELQHDLTPGKVRVLQRVTSPEAIANEGLALSRNFAFLKSTDHVDAAYEKTRWPIVRTQLEKAGASRLSWSARWLPTEAYTVKNREADRLAARSPSSQPSTQKRVRFGPGGLSLRVGLAVLNPIRRGPFIHA